MIRSASAPLIIALAILVAGCPKTHRGIEREINLEDVVLHLDYRSGGDAPIGFLMTATSDGSVRFFSPSRQAVWKQLEAGDFSALTGIIHSDEFLAAIAASEARKERFGCCDFNELGIYLKPTDEPAVVIFDKSSSRSSITEQLVDLVNRIGATYFKSNYTTALPSL